MQLNCIAIAFMLTISVQFLSAEGNSYPDSVLQQKHSVGLSPSSVWLMNVTHGRRPRHHGCRKRRGICRQERRMHRGQMRCCKNRCVDVSSDVNNCGLCGFRCTFTWQCCRGRCVNTNVSPFSCGRCGNRCDRGVRCEHGMCGYAETPSPLPSPWNPNPNQTERDDL